ncbi:MAG: hypothetical protein RL199_853, partial [Pseudomonadota bacterium]
MTNSCRGMKATLLAAMTAVGVACGGAPQEARPKAAAPAPVIATAAGAVEEAVTPVISLAEGAAWTKTKTVKVVLAPPAGATKYCLAKGTTAVPAACNPATAGTAFTASADGTFTIPSFDLGTGDGKKTVLVKFNDVAATTANDDIKLDATAPAIKSAKVDITLRADVDGQVPLKFTGFTDGTDVTKASGLSKYHVFSVADAAALKSLPACPATSGELASVTPAETGDTTWTHEDVSNFTTKHYAVCVEDAAGNMSAPVKVSVDVRADVTLPLVGKDAILSLPTASKVAAIAPVIKLKAGATGALITDASALEVCLTEAKTVCAADSASWQPLDEDLSFTLTDVEGKKTVSAYVRDIWKNVVAKPLTGSVVYDKTAPTAGTAVVTRGKATGTIAVTAKGFADKVSGLKAVTLGVVEKGEDASCATADRPEGATCVEAKGTWTCTGLADGTTYTFGLCAEDNAGNTVGPVTTDALSSPTLAAPTKGAIKINNGAAWTKAAEVSLSLSAESKSPVKVAAYCLSTGTTCSDWNAFTTQASVASQTVSYELSAGEGKKTINAWFRDEFFNATAKPVSASISVDTTAPVKGTASVTAGDGKVTATAAGFSDGTDKAKASGVATYSVVVSTAAEDLSCDDTSLGTVNVKKDSATVTGLTNGTTYHVLVCATDKAGNVTAADIKSAMPKHAIPPTNVKVSVEQGPNVLSIPAAGSKDPLLAKGSITVVAEAKSTGPAEVSKFCVTVGTKAATACPADGWQNAIDPEVTWSQSNVAVTVSGADGARSAVLFVEDSFGNVGKSAAVTFTLDKTAPAKGSIAVEADTTADASGTAKVKLQAAYTKPADAASWALVASSSGTPTCADESVVGGSTFPSKANDLLKTTAGTAAATGIVEGLEPGKTYSFVWCVFDKAGNSAASDAVSATTSGTAVPDCSSWSDCGCSDGQYFDGEGCAPCEHGGNGGSCSCTGTDVWSSSTLTCEACS